MLTAKFPQCIKCFLGWIAEVPAGPLLQALSVPRQGIEIVSSGTLERSWNTCPSQKGEAKLHSSDHREVPAVRGDPELF